MKNTISQRLILRFTIIICTLIIIISVVIATFCKEFIKSEVVKTNNLTINQISNDITWLFSKINQFSLSLYNVEPIYLCGDKQSSTQIYENLKKENKVIDDILSNVISYNLSDEIESILIYNSAEKNFYVGSGVFDKTRAIEEYRWYQKLLESRETTIIYGPTFEDYKPENIKKEKVMLFVKKIHIIPKYYDGDTPFILISVKYDEFANIFARLSSKKRGVIVTDNEDNIIYKDNISNDMYEDFSEIMEKRQIKNTKETLTLDKNHYFITSTYLEDVDFTVTTIDENRVLFSEVDDVISRIIILIGLAGIFAIILAVNLTKKITLPIKELSNFLDTMSKDKDSFIEIKGTDEFSEIGSQFNVMKHKINDANRKVYIEKIKSTEAQISALQAQINPHFIYNTLDSICSIAKVMEIDLISDLTHNLASMMRYSITNKDHYARLAKEIEHVKAYVGIINVRYDDKVKLMIDIDMKYHDMIIPKLILQPIVENSWQHGISTKGDGNITISACLVDGFLQITVLDNGNGITEKRLREINETLNSKDGNSNTSLEGNEIGEKNYYNVNRDGNNQDRIYIEDGVVNINEEINSTNNIALLNVHERLMLLSDNKYGIKVSSVENEGCEVVLRLPIIIE